MRDYGKGKVYELRCLTTGKVYIGSTTKYYLCHRLSGHRYNYKLFKEGRSKQYCTSFEVLEGGNYEMTLIESCPCSNWDELMARERHYIRERECVNKKVPLRSSTEYREDMRETILEKKRLDYLKNREKRCERERQYRRDNAELVRERQRGIHPCPCGDTYQYAHKTRHERSQKHQKWLSEQHTNV